MGRESLIEAGSEGDRIGKTCNGVTEHPADRTEGVEEGSELAEDGGAVERSSLNVRPGGESD